MINRRAAPIILLAGVLSALLWHASGGFVLRGWRIAGLPDSARVEVGRMMREMEGRSLPAIDLPKLREQILGLPGVADARVRRRLPDVLEVSLTPRQPLAYWSGGGLVDVRGVRYDGAAASRLPVFAGPAERAAIMADFYGDARELLSAADATIAQLNLGSDGDWRIFLRDGVMLRLGREDRRERLRRYARHAADLRRRFARLRAVDLRYDRGFAISTDDEGRI